MITTLDGFKVKRGDTVWEIGVTIKGAYQPTRSKLYSRSNPVTNEKMCWFTFLACQKECDKRNAAIKLIDK